MPVTLHLVRHAQGHHNLSQANEKLPDPDLTDKGRAQCASLRASFPHHDKITHLVASPLRRTLETCLQTFSGPGKKPAKKIMALPEVQEISTSPCDVGSDLDKLVAEYGDRVDFGRVDKEWNDKGPGSRWEPCVEKLEARALAARRALREFGGNDDVHVVVVSHGGILHFLTDDWHGIPGDRVTAWENTEYRSYVYVDPSGADPTAAIRETEESWNRRHGSEKGMPTREERDELRRVKRREMAPLLGYNGVEE